MIVRGWLVSVAFVALAIVGCAARSEWLQAGCKTVGDKAVTIRLVNVQTQEIDGVVAGVGRFEATSRRPDPLYVRGWKRDFGFLAEFPTARLQVREATWENVPMMGSFHSEGDESTAIAGEGRMTFFARVEYGVPQGSHQIRLVLRTTEGACLISTRSSTLSVTSERGNGPRRAHSEGQVQRHNASTHVVLRRWHRGARAAQRES